MATFEKVFGKGKTKGRRVCKWQISFGHPEDRSLWQGMKDEPPLPPRHVDDTRVPEELAEVALEGRRGRGVGRAELDEEDAGHCPGPVVSGQ